MKKVIEEFRKNCGEELGYISSIFMSQGDTKAGDIVIPTEKLEEAINRFELYLFKALAQQREEFRGVVEGVKKRFRCAACDGAKCHHTLGCQALTNILKTLDMKENPEVKE